MLSQVKAMVVKEREYSQVPSEKHAQIGDKMVSLIIVPSPVHLPAMASALATLPYHIRSQYY